MPKRVCPASGISRCTEMFSRVEMRSRASETLWAGAIWLHYRGPFGKVRLLCLWRGDCTFPFERKVSMATNAFEDSRISEGTMLIGAHHVSNIPVATPV